MSETVTEEFVKIVDKVVKTPESHHFHARVSGRLLEETVELALSLGLKPNDILGHVTDALCNEARKASTYPSALAFPYNDQEVIGELGDVRLLHDYLGWLLGMDEEALTQVMCHKIDTLKSLQENNGLIEVDCLVYRKANWERINLCQPSNRQSEPSPT